LSRARTFATLLLLYPSGLAVLLFGYSDRPPPAMTGGFGEATCHKCHFGSPLSESSESLKVDAPPRFEAGKTYVITVRLVRAGTKNSGFQLSARFKDTGHQAGGLRPMDGRTAVVPGESNPVRYIQHTREGIELTGTGEAEWRFQWEAPRRGAPVVMHVAANAGNRDDSEFGDSIHTRELTISPLPDKTEVKFYCSRQMTGGAVHSHSH